MNSTSFTCVITVKFVICMEPYGFYANMCREGKTISSVIKSISSEIRTIFSEIRTIFSEIRTNSSEIRTNSSEISEQLKPDEAVIHHLESI